MTAMIDRLTDEQRRILSHRSGPLRIAAGAGTGKTGTLQRAIIERIDSGTAPGEILCLTFTVEATKEMRRRVLKGLAGLEGIDPDACPLPGSTGSDSVTVMMITLAFKAFAKAIPCLTPFLATSDPSVLSRILAYIRRLLPAARHPTATSGGGQASQT